MTPATGRRLQALPPSATVEEAAAIVAAIERFMRATAPEPAENASTRPAGWRTAAILEGVSREPWLDAPDAWLRGG